MNLNLKLSPVFFVLAAMATLPAAAQMPGPTVPREWNDIAPSADDAHNGPKMPLPKPEQFHMPPKSKGQNQIAVPDQSLKAAPQVVAKPAAAAPAAPSQEKAQEDTGFVPVQSIPVPDTTVKIPIPGKPVRYVRVPNSSVRIDHKKPFMRVYYWPPDPPAGLDTMPGKDNTSSAYRIGYGIILDPIYFPFNESEMVAPSSYLDRVVCWMKADSSHALTLTGYADPRGTAARNKRLSLERARLVKAALVRLGAPGDRIDTIGAGATKTVHKSMTQEANHWGSRRVELRLHPVGRSAGSVLEESPIVTKEGGAQEDIPPAPRPEPAQVSGN